ncbi:hypothetical protein CANCADRAFT_22192 [Tortispora caseinolytica NRRL Y-17796]|uniref:RNA helicase n=1 Tax=Tortispora caseinolytica NRRL Y-17796 TaxID=767744 RepID=A0A1E4TLI0_9ASCO|nr:hypothetical protein CANCADRAFT_22192 [Tortispora caseinolytica NRRL Y-17796]
MAKYRSGYNDKARAGSLAKQQALKKARTHRVLKDNAPDEVEMVQPAAQTDANAEIMMPVSKEEKSKRKESMKRALVDPESKMSSKKKKRLDKYIEQQLRKEEKQLILQKLAKTSIPTTGLTSFKQMGTKETRKSKLQDALNMERAGTLTEEAAELLYEPLEPEPVLQVPEPEPSAVAPVIQAPAWPVAKKPKKEKLATGWRSKLTYAPQIDEPFDNVDSSDASTDESNESTDSQESESDSESDSGESWSGFSDELEAETSGLKDSELEENDSGSSDSDTKEMTSDVPSFKDWATAEITTVQGLEPTPNITVADIPESVLKSFKPTYHPEDFDAPGEDLLQDADLADSRPKYRLIERPDEIQEQRVALPIHAEEHRIMEAVLHHSVVIICGDTGSGKTTQVPQFLVEYGFSDHDGPCPGMIGVTQPRRVAAVSMAARVKKELGLSDKLVGYQIRFDSELDSNTAVKFMTDGVLLREMAKDLTLSKYSVIVIDEAHERNVNTDILIGMLSRVLKLRNAPESKHKLRLIIMSATLRVQDFAENKRLFIKAPPVIKVDGRQFPVSVHFNKRTPGDYIEEAYSKVCKIHKRLPPGGILVFLTGQQEINQVVRRLRATFKSPKTATEANIAPVSVSAKDTDMEIDDIDLGGSYNSDALADADDNDRDDYESDDEGFEETLPETNEAPLHVLPLYSLLPTSEQMRIFAEPPEGSRLCIVATNVAETSLTIPGIRYVVDAGRVKEVCYDKETRVQSYRINWISKASADQRAGRAGRVGPGHCYRLYSSAVYENYFDKFAEPEILRLPIEGVVLQMKSMNIDQVVNFPFPTPPDHESIKHAEKTLSYLSALDKKGSLTEIGRVMSLFPLSPRFSRMITVGNQHDCLPYVIALVAAFSVGEIFLSEQESGADLAQIEAKKALLSSYNKSRSAFAALDPKCDALMTLSAVCAYDYETSKEEFCKARFLRAREMKEIESLRSQIARIINVNSGGRYTIADTAKLPPPSAVQLRALKQIITIGFIDQIAARSDLVLDVPEEFAYKAKTLRSQPYVTLLPTKSLAYEVDGVSVQDQVVFVHPEAILAFQSSIPEFICYRLVKKSAGSGKLRIVPMTVPSGTQLAHLSKNTGLVTYSRPLTRPHPPKIEGNKRICWVVPRLGANIGTGGVGWDLPAIQVTQVKGPNGYEVV